MGARAGQTGGQGGRGLPLGSAAAGRCKFPGVGRCRESGGMGGAWARGQRGAPEHQEGEFLREQLDVTVLLRARRQEELRRLRCAKTELRCALSTARASSTTTSPRRPAAEGRRARQQVATRGREAPRPRRERQRGEASPKERRTGVAAPRRTGAEERRGSREARATIATGWRMLRVGYDSAPNSAPIEYLDRCPPSQA